MDNADKTLAATIAKAVTVLCVRNTFLENLHSGTAPSSQTGDYSDVKVVTPHGEIPWSQVWRISDEEMKRLMKEIVNKIYTFLCRQDEDAFIKAFIQWGGKQAPRWDDPELVQDFVIPSPSAAATSRPRKRR